MPKPNTLSRTAHAVLETAAARNDSLAVPPEHLPAAAKRAVVQSLLKAGLLEEVAANDDIQEWRTTEGGEGLALRATDAGLAAVGAAQTSAEKLNRNSAPTSGTPSQSGRDDQTSEVLVTADEGGTKPPTPARHHLSAAALAILAAWDDPDESRPNLPGAVRALRTGLMSNSALRTRTSTGTPRQPRPDTKRALVLALLRRPEGATVAQVTDTTGWATHTVRGFFVGLKKAGITVEVLERVRQVGPGKEGAKGSYNVYRVAEAD